MSHTMIVDRAVLRELHAEAMELTALAALLAENLVNRVIDQEDGLDLKHVCAVARQLARRLTAHCEAIEATGVHNAPLLSDAA